MRTKVVIIGEDKLRMKFRQMSAEAQGPLLDAAVQSGAEVIRHAIALRAPVKSGTLRRSIHTEKVDGA